MNKRPLFQMVLCAILGIAAASADTCRFLFPLLFASVVLILFAELGYKRRWHSFLWRFLFMAGFFAAGVLIQRQNVIQATDIEALANERDSIACQGKIVKKEIKKDQTVLYLEECILQKDAVCYDCNSILVYCDSDQYPIGKTIVLNGTLSPFQEARNEGNFDEKEYYATQKIYLRVQDVNIKKLYGKTKQYDEWLYRLRGRLKKVYEECMSKRNAGTMTVMVLGDKSLLDDEVKSLYQKAGISHVLCISGLHLSIVGMLLYRFLRKRGASYFFCGVLSGGLVYSFAKMSGFGVSSKRAVIMFFLLLVAQWLGKSYDSLTALAVAAFFLLWGNPFLIHSAGFLLSFGAVLGVAALGKSLVRLLDCGGRWGESVCISVGIQMMTLPVICTFYYEIPTVSMFINFLLLPFMGIVLVLGILGGVSGLLSASFGKLLLLLPGGILNGYDAVCAKATSFSYASWITGKPQMTQLVLYYGMLALFFLTAELWRKKRFSLLPLAAALFFLFLKPPKSMEVDLLDVGQGDGIYLCSSGGTSMFIDGGSTDVKQVGKYRILPFLKAKGVQGISYWFVSHTDADHVNGLLEIVEEGYPIHAVVFAKEVFRDEAFFSLEEKIKVHNIPILFLEEHDKVTSGDMTLQCIFPDTAYPIYEANARSLVLLYQDKNFSAIFTGDISTEEEQYITENEALPEVLFYKAAHHGSNYSNSKKFLKALSPQVCGISCGKNNRYGHPGKEALSNMKDETGFVCETTEAGQITLWQEQGNVYLRKYTKPLEVTVFPVLQ